MKKYKEFLNENKKKNTLIISGFPGIGKSHFYRKNKKEGKIVLDSDSSKFSWIKDENGNNTKERDPNFPNNYIKYIKENIGKADIILVSSHKNVRDALVENDIPFTLVYPHREIKEEYLQRYKDRGSDGPFVELLNNNWDNFINELEEQEGCDKIELEEGKYLSDYL